MHKTIEIQYFENLMELWVEGYATLDQEQELVYMAYRLHREQPAWLTAENMRDIRMLMDIAGVDTSAAWPEIPAQTIRSNKNIWKRIIPIAAAIAIIATVGYVTFKPSERQPVELIASNHTSVSEEVKIVENGENIKSESDDLHSMKQENLLEQTPTQSVAAKPRVLATSTSKSSPSVSPDTLQTREISDPNEAILLLNESCNLLADYVKQADISANQAASAFTDNFNKINEII